MVNTVGNTVVLEQQLGLQRLPDLTNSALKQTAAKEKG
jgi:hypothetical protein